MTLYFGREVVIELREMKVIAQNEPLLLIGADVLCGSHVGWLHCLLGMEPSSKGVVMFANGCRMVALPLVNAPVYRGPCFVSPSMT